MKNAVIGLFEHVDRLTDAADRFKKSGFGVTIFSPVPLGHEIDPVLGEKKNYVRYFTLFGGVTGLISGAVLALGTSALYVLPRGGRPIFFVTPTLIISYETTILFGVLMTLAGFFVLAGLPGYKKDIYHPEVAVDAFGLLVDNIREDEFPKVEKILKEYGAREVKRVEKT